MTTNQKKEDNLRQFLLTLKEKEPRIFVPDTNVAIIRHAVYSLMPYNAVVIPFEVLWELNKLKIGGISRQEDDTAKDLIRFLNSLGSGVAEGVVFNNPLSGEPSYVSGAIWTDDIYQGLKPQIAARLRAMQSLDPVRFPVDYRIIAIAARLKSQYGDLAPVRLISDDSLMRQIAVQLGLEIEIQEYLSVLNKQEAAELDQLNRGVREERKQARGKPARVYVPPFIIKALVKRGFSLIDEELLNILGLGELELGQRFLVINWRSQDNTYQAVFDRTENKLAGSSYLCFHRVDPGRDSGRLPSR